ncbi:hypothetical protein GCM10027594_21190 [Hymenobacter agri]
MNSPFFSIVIPTYNRAGFIGATLDSVLAQTFPHLEILVVDDGSKDNTAEVVGRYADPRLRYYPKENAERGVARNYGLARAHGEYVLFLDSDDRFHANHLATLHAKIQALGQPNFIATKYDFDRDGVIAPSDTAALPEGWYGLDTFVRGNALACNICVRRQNPGLHRFEEDRSYAAVEDWMFMLENTQHDRIYLVDAVTLTMNDHDQRSMRSDNTALVRRLQLALGWMLARVQLTQRNWAAAKAAADQVLSGGGNYSLQSFNGLFPAENRGPESIFEVQFAGTADGNTFFTLPDIMLPSPPATYAFPKFNIPTLFVRGSAALPTDLTSVVDTVNDQRWSYQGRVNAGRNHASYVDGRGGSPNDRGPFVYKWRSDGNGFNSSDNYYVLRLAEVYLTAAEASNEAASPAQTVLGYLNPIRQRAGLQPLTAASPEAASQGTLRTEIDKQRRLELAFEGERWFDLIRYARHELAGGGVRHSVTALDIIAQKRGARDANYLVFPLPLNELNTNTQLQQNPGY